MHSGDDTQLIDKRDGAANIGSAAPSDLAQISVVDVTKTFGVTRALDGCSFRARFGEIHAIVGGNGCGKSTLAKVLSGVLPVDSGHVSVNGHTPTSPRDARAAGIATVFQEVLVADGCSVKDNLFVGADGLFTKSMPSREKYAITETLMRDLTGLDIDPDALVGALPLSIKQWITIGRALLCRPKVLILDESSAALDLDATEKLFSKMRELRDQGSAVLIVTHRIAELIRISDRATVMRNGKDVGVLEKDDVTEKNILRLMTGRESSRQDHGPTADERQRDDVVMRAHGLKVWPAGDAFDFNLHEGEIVGVAGLDGQGQDEFVRILAGVQPALQGMPVVRGPQGEFEDLRDLDDARRNNVAYVSGDRKREGIFPNLSIFENMLIALYRRNVRGKHAGIIDWPSLSSVFDWGIEQLSVKIGHRSDKITSLSGGNQQKVLIGRALALRPNILVLNDPARGIDVEAKSELYDHLRDFSANGHSVVFMSSELEEFIGLCTRVIVFRHGTIFDSFTGEEIEPVRIFEAMFGQSTRHAARVKGGADASTGVQAPKATEVRKPAPVAALQRPVAQIRIVDNDRPEEDNATEPGVPADPAERMKIMYFDD